MEHSNYIVSNRQTAKVRRLDLLGSLSQFRCTDDLLLLISAAARLPESRFTSATFVCPARAKVMQTTRSGRFYEGDEVP